MTFGFAPRIEWDARIKGRGVVGVGEAADLIHHAQLAWMPAAERRRYALTGPPPPQWFTEMRPAPWIDGHVISEGRKLAGVSLVDVPPVAVPPGQDIHVPAQTRRDVPPDVPPPDTATGPQPDPAATRRPASTGPRAPPMSPSGAPGPSRGTAPPRRAMTPRTSSSGSRPPPATSATASPTASAGPAAATPSPARARPRTAAPAGPPERCGAGRASGKSPATGPTPANQANRAPPVTVRSQAGWAAWRRPGT